MECACSGSWRSSAECAAPSTQHRERESDVFAGSPPRAFKVEALTQFAGERSSRSHNSRTRRRHWCASTRPTCTSTPPCTCARAMAFNVEASQESREHAAHAHPTPRSALMSRWQNRARASPCQARLPANAGQFAVCLHTRPSAPHEQLIVTAAGTVHYAPQYFTETAAPGAYTRFPPRYVCSAPAPFGSASHGLMPPIVGIPP
jgi:hypothetical protein